MGWGFRRAIGLGRFRINLSKTGVGFSFGVRGFRIGRDAKGQSYTHSSVPGTGIYRRDYVAKGQPLDWRLLVGWLGPMILMAIVIVLVVYLFTRG